MTKFNPENKKELSYSETLKPAMLITDEADAKQYMADYIQYIQMTHNCGYSEAENSAKGNLSRFAGYYEKDVNNRVERLFIKRN